MELLTQVDAASQIGEQRAQMANDAFTKLEVLSKILHATGSGRDTTVDKLAEVIADVKTDSNQGESFSSLGGPQPNVQSVQHKESTGDDRVKTIESELAEIMKAMSEMKQWSREAKQNFKDEYNSQMLALRSQCASLQAELAVLTGEAPASDTSDYGTHSMRRGSEPGRGASAVRQSQSMDASNLAKSQANQSMGKLHEDAFSVSELGTADDSVPDRRSRKVKFDDNVQSPVQTTAGALSDATGMVPVGWTARPVDGGLVASRFLEKGAVNDTGIMIGDQLAEIDGQRVKDLAYDIVMPLLNGPTGSRVRLTVHRGDEPIRLMVERKAIATLRPGSASESRATTPGSEKSERSDTPLAQTSLGDTKEPEDKSSFKETAVVGKQRKGFVMMNPAAGSIKWTMHQSPRRLAEQERKMREEEEARIAAAERKQREAEDAARREEEELQKRALEQARRRAAEELQKRAEAEAVAKAEAEAAERARLMAEAKAKLEAEEAARKAAEEEAARRAEEARRKAEEEAARKAAEQERLQAELMAVERARKERVERDRLRMEEDRKNADAALAAGLKAARAFDVAAAKKMLDQAVQITKAGHIVDRTEQIQQLRVDTEFAHIKVVEMKVEGEIAQVRVILQREASPVDGRAFCREDIAEARQAIETARAGCVNLYDPAFYLEHLSRLSGEVDSAESRILAAPWLDSLGKGPAADQVAQTWKVSAALADPEAKPAQEEPSVKASPVKQVQSDDSDDDDEEERRRARMQKKSRLATPANLPTQDVSAEAAPAPAEATFVETAPETVAEESPASIEEPGGAKTPDHATPSPAPSGDADETQEAASESANNLITDFVDGMIDSAAVASEIAFESDNSAELTPEKKTSDGETVDSEVAVMHRAPTFKSKQPPTLSVKEIKSEPRCDDSEFQPSFVPDIAHVADPVDGITTMVATGEMAQHKAGFESTTETAYELAEPKTEEAPETTPVTAPVFKSKQPSSLLLEEIKADPRKLDAEFQRESVPEVAHDSDALLAGAESEEMHSLAIAREGAQAEAEGGNAEFQSESAHEVVHDRDALLAGAGSEEMRSLATAQEGAQADAEGGDAEFQRESVPEVAHDRDALLADAGSEEMRSLATAQEGAQADAEGEESDTPATQAPGAEDTPTTITGSGTEKATMQDPEQVEAAKAALRKEVEEEERARLKAEWEQEVEAAKKTLQAQLEQREAEKQALVNHMNRDKEELGELKAQLEALNQKLDGNEQGQGAGQSTNDSALSEEVIKLEREKEEIMQQMALEKAQLVSEYTQLEAMNAKLMEDLKAAANLNQKSPSPDQTEASGPSQEELRLAQQKASQEKDELMAQMEKEKQELMEHTKKLEEAHARMVEEAQLATMRLAAEKQSLEEQNRKLAEEKLAAERDLAEEKRLAELRQSQERLNVETTRTELPTKIEEERQRMEQKRHQEAMQEQLAEAQREQAEAKRIAQEEEQQRIEEERRNMLLELEREKAEALEKADAAEAERARLAAELEAERAKLSAELEAERQRAAHEAALLERKLAEATTAEEQRQAAEQRQREEEEKKKTEEQAMLQHEIEKHKQAAMESMQQTLEEEKAKMAAAAENEKLKLAAAAEEERIRLEEEKAQLLAAAEEEKAKLAAAAEQERERVEEEMAQQAEAAAEAESAALAKIRLEDEQAQLEAATAAEEERARQLQEEQAQSTAAPDGEEMPVEQAPVEVELVLDMDMDEITDKQEEFEADLCQELCAAINADSSKMAVLQLQAGSIIARIVLKPGISLVDGVTIEDVVKELMRQLDDPESALRQGRYGSRAKSLKILNVQDISSGHDEVGDVDNKLVEISPQRDSSLGNGVQTTEADDDKPVRQDSPRLDQEQPAVDTRSEVRIRFVDDKQDVEPPLPADAVDDSKQALSSSAEHAPVVDDAGSAACDVPPASNLPVGGFVDAVYAIAMERIEEKRHTLADEQASMQAQRRCRGTLLTISSDWAEAWEGTKVVKSDEDDDDEDSWLGGTMFEKRQDHEQDGAMSHEKLESPHLSPLSKGGAKRRIPTFKPPRSLEAWGRRDVMPMHKTNLALRQEQSKEQLSYEDVSDEEIAAERPDWYGRNPKGAAPQKCPAFPPVHPMPPIKKNPYSTTVPGLNPPVSPLTMKRSKVDIHASTFAEDAGGQDNDMLSVEAQMELGELLGEMLSSELGEDPATEASSASQMDANPPSDASLLSDLRQWRVARTDHKEEQNAQEPASLPSSFPKDDRDAAGGDHSNRMSWVPQLYARSGLLSKQKNRTFLDAFGDFSGDDVPLAPPKEVILPVIPRAPKMSYRVGETSKKKWQSYAAMSEHERYAKLKKEAVSAVQKTSQLPSEH